MTRITLAETNARLDAMDTKFDTLLALLKAQAPAKEATTKAPSTKAPQKTPSTKVSRCKAKTNAGTRCKRDGVGGFCGSHKPAQAAPSKKASKKAAEKAPVQKPASKGARAVAGGSGLSRSAWNKTLTTKARLAGKRTDGVSFYKHLTSNWDAVQGMRSEGYTPDEVLATLGGK